MRKLLCFMIVLFLWGCSAETSQMQKALTLREQLLKSEGCSYNAEISADFGDKVYSFTLSCSGKKDGNVIFSVVSPESISGISGVLSADGGKITFDEDRALAFPMLAEGELTPISAGWILYETLRSGYITSCGTDADGIRVTLNDTYEDEALQVDVWLNGEDLPEKAEIFWEGRLVLSMKITNFQIL